MYYLNPDCLSEEALSDRRGYCGVKIERMRAGPFFQSDPILLTLAADQRFGALNPDLDAVWQLSLNPNGPLFLETSFGLLVERFRVFPVFLVNNKAIAEISAFLSPPRVDQIFSNYASISCAPSEGLQARCEYWAAESASLLARITLTNTSEAPLNLGLQSTADLCPREGTLGMRAATFGYQPFLAGTSGRLIIALAQAGDSQPVNSPYPALQKVVELAPGQSFSTYVRCCAGFEQKSLEKKVFEAHPEKWDAEIARLSLRHQADLLRVTTPQADWDAVFLSAQNQAFQLLARGENETAPISYLEHRSPEQSYAQRPNGKDSSAVLKPPLNALPLYQLCQVLLPAQAQAAASIFTQRMTTLPDCSRLPVNARKVLPFPCLCSNALKIFLQSRDREILASVYERLRQYTLAWFDEAHDLDQDGLPEWLTVAQTGWENHPSFNFLNPHRLYTWITSVENLGLCQLMLRELDALEQIARVLDDDRTVSIANALNLRLSTSLERIRTDLPDASCWDRDTHLSTPECMYYEGPFAEIPKPLKLDPPSRVNVKLIFCAYVNKPGCLALRGTGLDGELLEEHIDAGEILRLPDCLALTSSAVFANLESLSAPDLDERTWIQLYACDLTLKDIGWYLGWQAPPPAEESLERDQNLEESPFASYPFGLPEVVEEKAAQLSTQVVNPAWNTFILEHLIQSGAKKEASELFANLMRGAASVLSKEHTFYEAWKSTDALPAGRHGAAAGLVPLQAFLELAGIRVLAPDKVQITGEYPFDWPLIVRYQGLEIVREGKNSAITMPDGTVFHHFGSQPKTFQGERA